MFAQEKSMVPADYDSLKEKLDVLYETYDRRFLYSDPVCFVHRYRDPADREVVGLLCSCLAYGNVKMIQRSLERLLAALGPHPAEYIRRFEPSRAVPALADFSHRFTRGTDIVLLLFYMKQMLQMCGSIGQFFNGGHSPMHPDVEPALTDFVGRALALDCTPIYPDGVLPPNAGVRFFFPSPTNRSACKRLNLYLRWMVRHDDIDFGLWRFISPSQLVIPLDTHVARICKLIGLTARASAGWATAVQITRNLKRLDPRDPVKYDFAISRLGILSHCPKISTLDKCGRCEIRRFCATGGARPQMAPGRTNAPFRKRNR